MLLRGGVRETGKTTRQTHWEDFGPSPTPEKSEKIEKYIVIGKENEFYNTVLPPF